MEFNECEYGYEAYCIKTKCEACDKEGLDYSCVTAPDYSEIVVCPECAKDMDKAWSKIWEKRSLCRP